MRRRAFLASGLIGATSVPLQAFSQDARARVPEEMELIKDFVGPTDDPDFGKQISGVTPVGQVGTGSSRHEEVAKAMRLMFNAPVEVFRRHINGEKVILRSGRKSQDGTFKEIETGIVFDPGNPISYAAYFNQITDLNRDNELYKAEWNSVRANPLIVGFFGMTNSLPSDGDQTAWCAAFVNFCLTAAGKQGTFSALSGSFRTHGEDAEDVGGAVPGDIVVFKKTGEDGNKGFGHVGFFVAAEGDSLWVLGGNQRADSPNTNNPSKGEVALTKFPRFGSSLTLADAGIRRAPTTKF